MNENNKTIIIISAAIILLVNLTMLNYFIIRRNADDLVKVKQAQFQIRIEENERRAKQCIESGGRIMFDMGEVYCERK